MDLDLTIDRSARALLSHQIGRQLIDLISTGALAAGCQLPSTRDLARQLGVSRMTIVEAYAWLCDQNFAVTRQGARTVVRRLEMPVVGPTTLKDAKPESATKQDRVAIDFRPGLPDLGLFPRQSWISALTRSARKLPVSSLGYGDPLGHEPLREAISRYLQRSRAFDVDPDNIVITAGTAQAVDLLLRVLPLCQDIVVEAPGPDALRTLPRSHNKSLCEVAIDRNGLRTDRLPRSKVPRLAYVIPSHQFPLGCTLSIERRLELIAWAEDTDAFIVEDDYDSEFAYNGRPAVPLAKLDRSGRVIYAGTFSKTLAPALRIGFMIVPDHLLDRIRSLKWWVDHGGWTLQQDALARWIDNGFFERHVRRMRRVYRDRFETLTSELRRLLGPRIEVVGQPVGMHVAAFVESKTSSAVYTSRARAAGIGIYPMQPPDDTLQPARAGFVFGFGNVPTSDVTLGARLFAETILAAD